MVTITDPYIESLINERDRALALNRELEEAMQAARDVLMCVCGDAQERQSAACATIQRLSDECESQANEIDCLRTLIKNINEVYINMDEPGLMSWSERTAKRVEIVNDVNLLLAEMENGNAHSRNDS